MTNGSWRLTVPVFLPLEDVLSVPWDRGRSPVMWKDEREEEMGWVPGCWVGDVGLGIYWTDLVEECGICWLLDESNPSPPRLATGRPATGEMWLDFVYPGLMCHDSPFSGDSHFSLEPSIYHGSCRVWLTCFNVLSKAELRPAWTM